jgi:hypothetical protein
MPSDDRDRQLERALKRHLGNRSQEVECPDAETLAAYHERTLSLDEMNRWKEHFQACAQCQETLALLEMTDNAINPELIEQAKHSEQKEEIVQQLAGHGQEEVQQPEELLELALPATATRSAAPVERAPKAAAESAVESTPEVVPIAAVAVVGSAYAEPATAAKRSKVRRTFQWLVPIGAVAAAGVIWFAVHQRQESALVSDQVAENRELSGDSTALRSDSREQDKTQNEPSAQPAAPLDPSTARDNAPAQVEPAPPSKSSKGERKELPSNLDQDNYAAKQEEAAPDSARRSRAASALSVHPQSSLENQPAVPPPPMLSPSREAAGAAASPKPSSPAASMDAPNALRQEQSLLKQKKDLAAQADLSASAAAVRRVAAADRSVIVAPGDEQIWIAKAAGKVSHSSDAGKTWAPQVTGVSTDLLTGTAPNAFVVWIVGKSGTILVTTDSGLHWQTVTSPITGDLGGVHASDANHATIWDEANRKSFQTKDGGVHWTQVANE